MYVNVGNYAVDNDIEDKLVAPGITYANINLIPGLGAQSQTVDGDYDGSIMLYALSVGFRF